MRKVSLKSSQHGELTFNPSAWGAETGRPPWFRDQPGIHGKVQDSHSYTMWSCLNKNERNAAPRNALHYWEIWGHYKNKIRENLLCFWLLRATQCPFLHNAIYHPLLGGGLNWPGHLQWTTVLIPNLQHFSRLKTEYKYAKLPFYLNYLKTLNGLFIRLILY